MTTPFYTGTVPFAGVDPGEPQFWPTVPAEFWVAKPSIGKVVQLPSIRDNGTYEAPPSQGEIEQGLAGGASAVTRFASEMRRWTLTYERLSGRDYQVVTALRKRLLLGNGPWCYLHPEGTNRLTYAQSVCGLANAVAEGWTPSVGTVTYDSTVAAADLACGVLRWSGAGNGSLLVAGGYGGGSPDADVLHSAPYVPARSWEGDVWITAASGTPSANVRLVGIAADGVTVVTSIDGGTVVLSTTPQRLTCYIDPGVLGASAYIVLVVRCLTASSPDLLVSCPWLTDRPFDIDGWTLGGGVPRVIWPTPPGRALGWHMGSDLTVTFAEAITGAA